MIYDHRKIEKKWRKVWVDEKVYQPFGLRPQGKPQKPKFYNLMMFPYPSAEGLHVGNMYAFTGADVYGRFKRMQGYDVFEPIGLDGFGIHSENYALQIGRHPAEQAKVSQAHFYDQLSKIGNGFAWDQRLETYDPEYYKWTQWLFVQMYKHGLAYRGKAKVNWCPSCKTVLADEQVEAGRCERCKTEVVRREMEQWWFKITAYADRLLANLEKIDWPKKIKIAQRNWIGKKEGINIAYPIKGSKETVTCFTTRPDTNFGATFVVIAPEHILAQKSKVKAVKDYVSKALRKTEQERLAEGKKKTGAFTGLYAINHLTGYEMPVWVSDFVLGGIGTGAVVGVPGHDQRDFEFAQEFNLEVKRVVVGSDGDKSAITQAEQVQEEEGRMINSGFLDGLDIHEATGEIMDYMEEKGQGKRVTTYHLRDWLISRQRYWGPPIPMIYCEECKWQPVTEEDLPVILPEVEEWRPMGRGKSPLETAPRDWLKVACPECGKPARRETDVSDTFLDSAWYFLRYPSIRSAHSGQAPFDPGITQKWLPVDAYIGGAEHAVLHLLYSRFVWMALKDWGYLKGVDSDEPFPFLFSHGLIIKDGAKMSKSRGNVVNPDEYIERYGADALRMYLMFVGPYSQGGDFRDTGMVGMYRFLERIWKLFQEQFSENTDPELKRKLHRTIKKVTQDLESFKYNTAIAAMMELTNAWEGKMMSREDTEKVVKLLAPLAPYFTEELWQELRQNKRFSREDSVHRQSWPEWQEKWIKQDQVTVVVQVNGRVRSTLDVRSQMADDREEVIKMAREGERVKKYLDGKKIKQVVWVPQRLINFVLE